MKTRLLKKLRADAERVYEDLVFVTDRGWCIYGTIKEFPFPDGRSTLKYQSLDDDKERTKRLLDSGRRRYILERLKRDFYHNSSKKKQ